MTLDIGVCIASSIRTSWNRQECSPRSTDKRKRAVWVSEHPAVRGKT